MSFGSVMGFLSSLAGGHTPKDEIPVHSSYSPVAGLGWGLSSVFGIGNGEGNGHYGLDDMLHVRRVLFWIAAMVIVLLVAAVTNPTEAAFRSHLTELSFRRHLADIRHSDSDNRSEEPSTSSSTDVVPSSNSTETPAIAPFRFANHVAISLRTPPLYYKTLFFLSIALTTPLTSPTYLSDPTPLNKKHAAPPPRERHVLYVGYLGHWVMFGQIPMKVEWIWRMLTEGTRDKRGKKNALLDRPGITELRSIAGKDESLNGLKALASASTLSVRGIRRSDSTATLGEHLGTLPLHSHPSPIPIAPFVSESRRPSIVNLVPAQSLAPPSLDTDTSSSPLLTGLKADLAAAQAALAEVKAQLVSHEESVSSGSLHLQTSLDEVRHRRKEDDVERSELKSRTKSLEEQKRQAEGARREAEKKLKAIEAVRDGLEAKINAALGEISELKGLMDSSVKNLRTIQEQGARCVIETRENFDVKKEELEDVENDIGELDARNEELLRAIKEAEEKVESAIKAGEEARKIGPEEEMMMMAAAYEAAAQEGYNTQTHAQSTGTTNHGYRERGNGGNDQWAHQAAQYMAEAGMPYIDHQNYTARPSHSTSFGQFAKPQKSEEKRPADFIGFEDFGPGARNRLGGMTTPPASDSGSDVWGHDPGSPNGGISSSFSQGLLPQGLFRSLEGDQTPLDASTDISEEDITGVAAITEEEDFDPSFNGHRLDQLEDGSESGSSGVEGDIEPDNNQNQGQQYPWRHNLPPNAASNAFYSGTSTSERQLLPPSSHTPPGQPGGPTPSLPGLPVPLHGSRRWFSGTSSTDQVNNINVFGVSPSNDSLLLPPGTTGSGPSPFAPTVSEQQRFALGRLGKRWGRPTEQPQQVMGSQSGRIPNPTSTSTSTSDVPASSSTSGGFGFGRSISADLGGSWLSRSSRKEPSPSANASTSQTSGSQGIDIENQQSRRHQNNQNDSLAPGGSSLGSLGSQSSSAEKKPFRFFSLRRPTSSGSTADRSGTSPARETKD